MALYSKAPNPAARTASSSSALSDALGAWSLPTFANSVITNTILVGASQYMGLDEYFAASPGENAAMAAIKEALWVSSVSNIGQMTRTAIPMLRIW